ncbi:MAG: glycosyltransferase family 2 protein [Solirubrobacteraceae bacterium]|nr:glycosyltransferase family 2 protein [Solirubrobacteraceae bacterium]
MPAAVSIAIPTFNRRATLERAVRSALGQTHVDLEVVVSDNASSDGTVELLDRLAADDDRLRTVRQRANRGMVANLNAAIAMARGDHVMLLADDDWLAPRCVEAALGALRSEPGAVSALGRVTYLSDAEPAPGDRTKALLGGSGQIRVRDYFATVPSDHGNTWLYGLSPRETVQRLAPMRNVLGFDWLRVAELAFLGKIVLVDEPLIFRELGGTSESTARNVRESRLPAMQAKLPHLVIAGHVLSEIGWRSPVYAPLGRRRRLALAAACASNVPRHSLRHVLFHLAPQTAQDRWHRRA